MVHYLPNASLPCRDENENENEKMPDAAHACSPDSPTILSILFCFNNSQLVICGPLHYCRVLDSDGPSATCSFTAELGRSPSSSLCSCISCKSCVAAPLA